MIRPAVVGDAAAIAALQFRAWLRAYQDILDPMVFAGYDIEGRLARWELTLSGSSHGTLVAVVADEVRGFVTVGSARGEDEAPGRGEVWALYVDPPAQGAGLGTGLLAAGEELMRGEGMTEAVLWVLADNGYARDFYAGRGWSFVEGSETPGRYDAPEVKYARAL